MVADAEPMAVPAGLSAGGVGLWTSYSAAGLSAAQLVHLEEACRAKDRLDRLDLILRGDVDTWARLLHRVQTEDYELRIDDALTKANATAANMRQLLAALPVEAVKKPEAKNVADEIAKRRAARGPASASKSRPAKRQ
jgi:hypothetical protein